jgi:hypothetical protein
MEVPIDYCKVLGNCGHLNHAITQVYALVVKKLPLTAGQP